MQDFPTSAELLEALAAYLFGDVRPLVPREERFRVLVAANICAVVAREIRAGNEPDEADRAAFLRLLGGAGPTDTKEAAADLAARIRAGQLDSSLPEVIAEMREHARRKLEIARPGYAEA